MRSWSLPKLQLWARLAEEAELHWFQKIAVTLNDPKQLGDAADRIGRELAGPRAASEKSQTPMSAEEFRKLL